MGDKQRTKQRENNKNKELIVPLNKMQYDSRLLMRTIELIHENNLETF